MIFGVVVILVIGAIAYFHYVQGLFSATLSAIIAILAAVLAVSYHETVIFALLKGKAANYAHALVLVALFAAAYLILRIIFDSLVPGNIRFPVMVDRVGAAIMGIVAGIFATGVLAIAAATLPFGPSGPYARYETADTPQVTVPTGGRDMDAAMHDQLKEAQPGQFNAERAAGMIVPADDIVMNMVDRLSTGALAGARPLKTVHPSYLDELFGQRLGTQIGARRVAYNLPSGEQISLGGLYQLDAVPSADGEFSQIRGGPSLDLTRKPDHMLLVTRIRFGRDTDDADHNIRLGPGAARLVAGGMNHMPVGAIDENGVLRINVPDDFLVLPADGVVDLVYQIPRADLGSKSGSSAIGPGVFMEVKRMAVIDLADRAVESYPGPLEEKTVFRKKSLPEPKAAPNAPAPRPSAAAPAADSPIVFSRAEVSDKLFTAINIGTPPENGDAAFTSGQATIREKKFAKLTVNMTETIQRLGAGEYTVNELFVPPGMKVVQIIATAPAKSPPEPWDWAEKLGQFELVDATGAKHKPRGGWAQVTGAQGSKRMVAMYDADAAVSDIPHEEGRPTDVWLAFHVPPGTQLKELTFNGKRVAEVKLQVQ